VASSANKPSLLSQESGRSLINRRKSAGPKIEPWGIPEDNT